MVRPRAEQSPFDTEERPRYLIIDGYIDEPAALGVPPYLSPQARALAGGLVDGGSDESSIGYMTADQWRAARKERSWKELSDGLEFAVCLMGCIVPGRYLRGMPLSMRELKELNKELKETDLVVCGPSAVDIEDEGLLVSRGDPGVLGSSISSCGLVEDRARSKEEWDIHLHLGAFIAERHPDHPSPLICEIETSSGCPRYITGGCSFCSEPLKGPVEYRDTAGILEEVRLLASFGVENIRIGGQSDLISYLTPEAGKKERPVPNPKALDEMLSGAHRELYEGRGVREAVKRGARPGIDTGIVHTDNANPAVIREHSNEAEEILGSVVKHCTSGNVLALGLESSDPEVARLNNLNSGPDDVFFTVKLMNRIGGARGPNGLPMLLPGLNFLGGLPGQTEDSFGSDLELLKRILDEELLLRRINIRKAVFPKSKGKVLRSSGSKRVLSRFRSFKEEVRRSFDIMFMERLLPRGTILKGVFMEAYSGRTGFGRQIGTYPILVGVEQKIPVGSRTDVCIWRVSSRSATGFVSPFPVNRVSFRELSALPGVGSRKAATIFRGRPVSIKDLSEVLGENDQWLLEHMDLSASDPVFDHGES